MIDLPCISYGIGSLHITLVTETAGMLVVARGWDGMISV